MNSKAVKTADMSNVLPMDRKIFELHNQLRENPLSMIPDLEIMATKYRENGDYVRGNHRPTMRTRDGVEAVKEAIEFLRKQTPMQSIRWSNELYEAAKAHVEDIGPKGMISHESSSFPNQPGVPAKERLKKYGNIIACYGESLAF